MEIFGNGNKLKIVEVGWMGSPMAIFVVVSCDCGCANWENGRDNQFACFDDAKEFAIKICSKKKENKRGKK